jgi:hypothetical protein
MYTFSNRLKIGSVILMAIGLLGMGYGFFTMPSNVEEAKAMVASHDTGHGEAAATEAGHSEGTTHAVAAESHDASHDEHLLHQLQNRPWAALYVAAIFFMVIALGVLAFYAIQRAAQAGWSPLLFRIMEGITAYLVPGAIIVFVILVLSVLHMNHLFVWMDSEVVAHDKLLQGKAGYLNPTFFLIRAVIFMGGWILYREYSRKLSLAQDNADDNASFKKNFRISAGFLVFYLVTESMMSWDWLMSLEPHWFSTLFGWYVFASMIVSGITVIAMITIYLKSRGFLPNVNNSHVHDLAKYMFGFCIFWAYLWFSQFMLIWYANIPEEVTYFVARIADYKLPFFGMLVTNFVLPFLLLMNSDFKRVNWFVVMAGIIILGGQYINFFQMIMPSTVGDQWYIGIPEIGAVMFFAGFFIFWVFRAMASAPLEAQGDPFIEESRHYHY